MKSSGDVEATFIFRISWNFLQPLVMVVMDKLKILAISLALRGTPLFLHDMYMLDAINPFRLSPLDILVSDSCLYISLASSIIDWEMPPLDAFEFNLLITL